MMRYVLLMTATVLVGCTQSEADGLYLEDLGASGEIESEETARMGAMDDVEVALEDADMAPDLAWRSIDADATVMAAREEARRDGCEVTGIVGGAWADEDNRFRGQVRRFEGGGAFIGGFYKGLNEDGGVWAGRWEGRAGFTEGNLGGLYSSSHWMRGKWSGELGGHGRMIGAWRRLGPRGGAFFGVWAACD